MKIFGISDLHLSFQSDKPMDIFGDNWKEHANKMAQAWDNMVNPHDIVLVPGDHSWAMKLDEAKKDLEWIGQRPGKKILVKGNHDLWWSSISKVRASIPSCCIALQNDSYDIGEFVVAGSRCWSAPGSFDYTKQDEKIYERELHRLELSLEHAVKLGQGKPIIAAIHYPPFTMKRQNTAFADLMEKYPVKICVYGHLHGKESFKYALEGEKNGIIYYLLSCDYLDFSPRLIWPMDTNFNRDVACV